MTSRFTAKVRENSLNLKVETESNEAFKLKIISLKQIFDFV